MINPTPANRNTLRRHSREALADYSPVMTWLVLDANGDLEIITEPQGQTEYTGADEVIATTGDFHKAHGNGAETDSHGNKYRTQRDYLTDLLGADCYVRIFGV